MNDGYPSNPPLSRAGLLARITGAATLAAGALLYGDGTSQLQTLAPGTSGKLLRSNGAAAPSYGNLAENFTGGVATFGGTLTAARTYTLPDAATTLAGLSVAQTWTAAQSFTATVSISRSSSGTAFQINRTADTVDTDLTWTTAGVSRWIIRHSVAETGAAAGGDLLLIPRDDAGANAGTMLTLIRASKQAVWSAGTEALPTLTFTGSLGLGFYKAGTNILGISASGVQYGQLGSSGIFTFARQSIAALNTASHSGASLNLHGLDGTDSAFASVGYGNGANVVVRFTGHVVQGTGVTPAATIAGDTVSLTFRGHTGASFSSSESGRFSFVAGSTHSGPSREVYAEIATCPSGAITALVRQRWFSDGGVQIGGTYGTSPGANVLAVGTAIIAGAVARVGGEAFRSAGGTIATPTATDVILGGGQLATGSTLDATSSTAASVMLAGGLAVAKSAFFGINASILGILKGSRTSPTASAVVTDGVATLTVGLADGLVGSMSFQPAYDGAFTVTRHNYLTLDSPILTTSAVVTDACVIRFTAAAGTHKAIDAGTTKTTPGTVSSWVKINVNGTVHYIPAYTSKTT